ncbi:MAG: hypothetical protein JSV09_10015 [Thermoplasmata archaeon]|nr:MAG: hypothetical protein JSV09_10015 [Thermoplasmata archaeon]
MTTELGKRLLFIVAKRGYTGADREVFFHYIRGIKYERLEREVLALEREGLITIEWVGPSNFTVSITRDGAEFVKSFSQDIWRKSTEALKQLDRAKHKEKEIHIEKVGYSKMLGQKMHVEEVGELSHDIFEKLDEHVKADRDGSSEEAAPAVVAVPAVQEVLEHEGVAMDKDVVERRISGVINEEEEEGGEMVESFQEPLVIEGDSEDRIAVDSVTSLEKRTKEKRISGVVEENALDEETKEVEQKESPSPPSEESETVSSPMADVLSEEDSPLDFYQQIEAAIALGGPLDTDELIIEEEEEVKEDEKTMNEPSTNPTKTRCLWERDRECPILKNKEPETDFTLTPNHCTVCQLIEIKNLLKK